MQPAQAQPSSAGAGVARSPVDHALQPCDIVCDTQRQFGLMPVAVRFQPARTHMPARGERLKHQGLIT